MEMVIGRVNLSEACYCGGFSSKPNGDFITEKPLYIFA